jgi:hypothetical protein
MRKVTAALAAAGLATVLAACTSTVKPKDNQPSEPASHGVDAAAFVAQSTNATQQAQTVKLKITAAMLGQSYTATGAERFGAKNTDAHVTSTTPIGPVEAIVVDNTVYTKGIEPGQPGKPWVKNAIGSQQVAQLLQQADPRRILPLLSSVGTLTPAGHQNVNGVDTTHYTVTVDLAKVAKAARTDLGQLQAAFAAGLRDVNVQVWVDDQQRLSRLTLLLSEDNAMNVSQTVDYIEWGAPVTIAAPPANQVTEQ